MALLFGVGSERGLCCCLASGGLPSTPPVSNHFTHFQYATGAPPAVALVLNPTVGEFAYVLRPCRPFKQSFLKIWLFLLPPQYPLFFTARSDGFYLPSMKPWAVQSGLWLLGLLTPKVPLLIFIHHTWIWDHLCLFCHQCCLSAPHRFSSLCTPSLCLHPSCPSGWMWLL